MRVCVRACVCVCVRECLRACVKLYRMQDVVYLSGTIKPLCSATSIASLVKTFLHSLPELEHLSIYYFVNVPYEHVFFCVLHPAVWVFFT